MPNTTDARTLSRQMQERVEAILKAEFGDRVECRGGSFDVTGATLKFHFSFAENAEDKAEALRKKFAECAFLFGLAPSDFDLPLTVNGKPAKLVEIAPNRPANPFIFQTADGRLWKGKPDNFLLARMKSAAVRKAA